MFNLKKLSLALNAKDQLNPFLRSHVLKHLQQYALCWQKKFFTPKFLPRLKGGSVPSEHGSIPGNSGWPFFIQVLNYIQKSRVSTRSQPWPHGSALQKAKAGTLTACDLCSVYMYVPLKQSCQLSCFCLQHHSLLLRSSVCRLFKQPWDLIFWVIWACSSHSISKQQFWVEDQTMQPTKQPVNFRTGASSF